MTELWRLSATEIADLVKRREVSATEVARSALARLDVVNGAINAVVECRPGEVLARAAAVDAALRSGTEAGPLVGVPVTTKVNTDQAGFATTNGVTLQRDLIAPANNPVIDNLLRAGAVLLGRTNAPAFSFRWFTDNRLHGRTRNPRDTSLTPGGSSGGAAAALAAGIGALAQGTDVAGSLRYPSYACGVHGLRPTPGRVPNWNPSSPDRRIGAQLTLVQGPMARSVEDLRLALKAMSAPDDRDPWWVPAPIVGPPAPRRAALCIRPDGLATTPQVGAALEDAAIRLRAAGWEVAEVATLPPLREAAEMQTRLWLGDGYDALLDAAERESDAGALAVLRYHEATARSVDREAYARLFVRRLALIREWTELLAHTPIVLMPVSAELPFPDRLDLQGDAALGRIWEAQLTQLAIPALGLPALVVSTGLVGDASVGVQVVAGRFREDLCLEVGEALAAGSQVSTSVTPNDQKHTTTSEC